MDSKKYQFLLHNQLITNKTRPTCHAKHLFIDRVSLMKEDDIIRNATAFTTNHARVVGALFNTKVIA